jgi:glutathione S-transferase
MKLYYSPGACSLAPHIIAREAAVPEELIRVDLRTHTIGSQHDFLKINPRGYVPVLEVDGEMHTEVVALVQYLAELAPESNLLPAAGSAARFRASQWLGFISSELHKTLSPWLFREDAHDSTKNAVRAKIASRFAELESHLADRSYLMGEQFTVADAYAFTIVSWSSFLKIDLKPYPKLQAYQARVAARPKVREALAAEGLLSKAA